MALTEHSLEGVLLIDKPTGLTSHDVVDHIRRKLKMRRIGHAGTLDPNATGLLIILVGKATRISQYLMSLDKTYEGVIKLGEVTDSHDAEGKIIEEHEVPAMEAEKVRNCLGEFLGDQYQTPPMYSAIKIDGVPLYKLARKGKTVKREPRFIRVSAIGMIRFASPLIAFRIECSKGTYVRTLAHDLGRKLGCGAHLSELRRLAIERFRIEDAIPLQDFERMEIGTIRKALIPAFQAVPSNIL